MSEYNYSVKLVEFNTVEVKIYRDDEVAFRFKVEPVDAGLFRFIFNAVFFGFAKAQKIMLEKSHKLAFGYIENMKEFEK